MSWLYPLEVNATYGKCVGDEKIEHRICNAVALCDLRVQRLKSSLFFYTCQLPVATKQHQILFPEKIIRQLEECDDELIFVSFFASVYSFTKAASTNYIIAPYCCMSLLSLCSKGACWFRTSLLMKPSGNSNSLYTILVTKHMSSN